MHSQKLKELRKKMKQDLIQRDKQEITTNIKESRYKAKYVFRHFTKLPKYLKNIKR